MRGVASDIVLPDLFEYYKIREKDNPDALPWDEIAKAGYAPWKYAYDLNVIKGRSNDRLKNNAAFNLIHSDAAWLGSKESEKTSSLNLKKYQEEEKKLAATIKQIETLGKLPAGSELNFAALPQDSVKYDADKTKADRFRQWIKDEKADIYLGEAVNVLDDMISQKEPRLYRGKYAAWRCAGDGRFTERRLASVRWQNKKTCRWSRSRRFFLVKTIGGWPVPWLGFRRRSRKALRKSPYGDKASRAILRVARYG